MKIAFYGDSLTEGIPGISYVDIIRSKLPNHELINYGKAGDTVVSLHRRILRHRLTPPVDIAFLWIGVNDVFAKVAWHYPFLKTLLRQPQSRDVEEFKAHYQVILDLLCPQATRVITVSPLLIGEDVHNQWNRELEALSRAIRDISATYNNTQFLNLRSVVEPELLKRKKLVVEAGLLKRKHLDYVPKKATVLVWDALSLRCREQVDRKAAKRSLFLTLDGVHLNGHGAETISELFVNAARNMSR